MTDYLTTLFYLNKHCVSLPSPRKDNLREGGFIWVQDSGYFSPSFHRSQQAEREREGKGRKRERERESKMGGGESIAKHCLSFPPSFHSDSCLWALGTHIQDGLYLFHETSPEMPRGMLP